MPECPRRDESVWRFCLRRLPYVMNAGREEDRLRAALGRHRWSGGLPLALLAWVLTASAFAITGGLRGLATYGLSSALIVWGMQALTYVQHWGLGEDDLAASAASWEYDCQLQAWLTLGISLHQSHHQAPSLPFYRVGPAPDAPRQPAGYVVLLLASLIPPVWRKLMDGPLDRWVQGEHPPPGSSRGRCLRSFEGRRQSNARR